MGLPDNGEVQLFGHECDDTVRQGEEMGNNSSWAISFEAGAIAWLTARQLGRTAVNVNMQKQVGPSRV